MSVATHKFGKFHRICYLPTRELDIAVDFIQAKPDDVFYDLGCGGGHVLVAVAKRYGCRCVGIDADPERVQGTKTRIEREGVDHLVEVRYDNIFTANFSDATVIYCYLFYWVSVLVPLFNSVPNRRVITHHFHPSIGYKTPSSFRDSKVVPPARAQGREYPTGVRAFHEYITPIPQQ